MKVTTTTRMRLRKVVASTTMSRARCQPRGLGGLSLSKGNNVSQGVHFSSRRRRVETKAAAETQAAIEALHTIDPEHLHHHLAQALYSIADADVAAVAGDAAAVAGDAAAAAPRSGFFNTFAVVLESFLKGIDGVLDFLHVPYAYGFSIILLTILVKVGTFPLSKKQLESNLQIQALQPRIKQLQDQYADDQERLQLETAKLYKVAEVNPLAGCLPTFVSLPIYIGLYRSLTNAAEDGLLTDGFFWIPSLAGPTTIAARQAGTGSAWLFPFQDGAPPIGWHDAGAYLVLPVLLIVSQFVSQKILSGNQQQTQQNQSANAIIKLLPLMIGWFSLNVPSGLTLYWFTNNLLSVGQTAFLRANFKAPVIAGDVSTSGAIEVERVSAVQPKQIPSQQNDRSGDKFWALKRAEDSGNGSVVAEVLSKPSETERGSKFWDLKNAEESVAAEATSIDEVAEVAEVSAEVSAPAEHEGQVKVEASSQAPPPPPGAAVKKSSFKKKKGKASYQKRRK